MKPTPILTRFSSKEFDEYRDRISADLIEIRAARTSSRQDYPDVVKSILSNAASPKTLDASGRLLPSDLQPNPITVWVAERCQKQSSVTERAWACHVEASKLDLSKFSPDILRSMQQERAWRFWSQLVLATELVFSVKAVMRVRKDTAAAVSDFVEGASKVRNAVSALLADRHILYAACPQEVPFLRALQDGLPGLIETLGSLEVGDWYPYKNLRQDSKPRVWARDIAEIAIRNLGYCDGGLLEELLSANDLPHTAFEEKWYVEQSGEANRLVETYESRRHELDIRLPSSQQEEDLLRPDPLRSPWLGKSHSIAKGEVNRVF